MAGVVGRVDGPDGRWYVDPLDPELRYESVTHILGAANSSPWLVDWAARLAATWAVDNVDRIRWMPRDEAVAWAANEAARQRDLKALAGTYQHDVLEALILDTPIPGPPVDLLHRDADGDVVVDSSTGRPLGAVIDGDHYDYDTVATGLLNFLTDYDVTPLLAEATIAEPLRGYAGTLDALLQFPGMRDSWAGGAAVGQVGLVDCKTGRLIGRKASAQLAAYRRAAEVWIDKLGGRISMPPVDFTGVLHLRTSYPGGYQLYRQTPDMDAAGWEHFLHCQAVLRDRLTQSPGEPLYPPLPDGTQPAPVLAHLPDRGVRRAVQVLADHGVVRLDDLAGCTAREVRALHGVGGGTVDALRACLTKRGMTFVPAPDHPVSEVVAPRAVKALAAHGVHRVSDLTRVERATVAAWPGITNATLASLDTAAADCAVDWDANAMEVAS